MENINAIFSLLMDNDVGGAEYKASHMMNYGNELYDTEKDDINYNMEILEYENSDNIYSDEEIEIFTIANDIKEKAGKIRVFDKKDNKLRYSTYDDFVIILDRSKYFNLYKKIFEYLGIPLSILKDDDLNNNYDILIVKNLIELLIKINNKEFDETFKYDFVSILRSFLYEESDNNINKIVRENRYLETKLYNDLNGISDINSKSISVLLLDILNVTDFYNKIVKIGDFNNISTRMEYLYEMSCSLNDIGYGIEDFSEYLETLLSSDIKINYKTYTPNTNSVKIMTIHGSKGLEYPFCYFADLNHKFNVKELNEKFVVSNKYGLIIPTNLETQKDSIVKLLYKNSFYKDEVSEKERLLYVALTRAREKIVIVIPQKKGNKLELDECGLILNSRRSSFNNLVDYVYAVKEYLPSYFHSLDISKLNITKNYLYSKDVNKLEINNYSNIEVKELDIASNIIEDKHFSKENTLLLSRKEKEKLEYGTKIHEVLEYLDFNNPNLSVIKDDLIKNKIYKLINNPLFSNINDAKIYKEFEFVYISDNLLNHGIIDLMLEYSDHIDIIDYKLKNVVDDNYIKQLNGYKKYISDLTSKYINIYLYSIIDEKLKKLV